MERRQQVCTLLQLQRTLQWCNRDDAEAVRNLCYMSPLTVQFDRRRLIKRCYVLNDTQVESEECWSESVAEALAQLLGSSANTVELMS